jgi:hypothetical protein
MGIKFYSDGRELQTYKEMFLRWLQAKRDLPHLDHNEHKPSWPFKTDRRVRAHVEEELTREFNRRT